MSALLSVESVSKRYGRARAGAASTHALEHVSFTLEAGELVALVGPNGAGKTTLLSIIAGIHAPSAGAVTHVGERPAGWVPQLPALYSKLSAAENLELFARLEGVARPRALVASMLEQTGLSARAHEPLERLSAGNRQRVNVALGLIADPPLLVLDEPSAALDPAQRERLWGFIAGRVDAGTSVLFSTHNVSEAQRHATRVLVLAGGALLFDGTPAALMREGGQNPDGDLELALVRFLRERA